MLNKAGSKLTARAGKARASGRKLGRPRKPGAGSPHTVRVAFEPSQPLHVVLRVRREVHPLRRRAVYHAIREATLVAARRQDSFRIVHLSIQQTHVHLLVEAKGRMELARGLQSFQISAAKHINAAISKARRERRRGNVFTDRYHAEVIKVPRQARHALAYVLNNWRKHREDRSGDARRWLVDPFSSGCSFSGWKQLEGRLTMWTVPETYLPMFVWLPQTWLLSTGWRRYGLIDGHEVPSHRP
ncbi:MAG: transposase [Kofleriaceae bacterium]|nr:transposase [Kofleriaceae bacterium]